MAFVKAWDIVTKKCAQTYVLQDVALLFPGQAQVPFLAGAELGRQFVKLLFAFLDGSNLLLPEVLQGDDELEGLVQHPVLLILDGRDQPGELLQRPGNNQLVVCLVRSDALELEVFQGRGQPALGL